MPCILTPTALSGVLILEPTVYHDDRGFFLESFNAKEFERITSLKREFVQDNHSSSRRGVLRGLHYQIRHPQGKLVRVLAGEVFDVAVDLRRSSPTFGKSVTVRLSAENRRQLWVPEGFAHGFAVVNDYAELVYKTTDYWYPEHERTLLWNDAVLGIDWPLNRPTLAAKDAAGLQLAAAELFD